MQNNNLLVFMLRHGYINENYADYINYFHPGSITKEELNFILWVRDFKGENDYAFSIKHSANVVDRFYDYEFEQVEMLNFDLTDYLIENNESNEKLQALIKQLINQSETSIKYMKAYIDRGKHIEQFIRLLCHESCLIWVGFMYDGKLSEEKKAKYFKLMIRECDIYDIENNNVGYEDEEAEIDSDGVVREYFTSQKNILNEMSDVSWDKIKQVIDELEIKFDNLNLEGLDQHIIDDIITERYFELNHAMMEEIYKVLGDAEEEGILFKCNYQWLVKLNNKPLLDYVHDNFLAYVRCFIIGEESNTEEETKSVDSILQRVFEEDTDLCITIIEKEHLAYWERLTDCLVDFEDKEKQEIWDCLLQNNRTRASWSNYLNYYDLFGLTETLLHYFDENIDAILETEKESGVTDEIIKVLIVAELSDSSFEKLVSNCKVEEFTNKFDELSESKLKILIQKHYFEFTPQRFAELKQISRDLGTKFIFENKSEFLADMEQYAVDLTDIKEILKLQMFDKDNLLRLLELINPMDVDAEFAILVKDVKFLLPKEYVEAIWQLLDDCDKYQFLYVQMDVFDLDEIAEKFGELGGVYGQFSSRTRHRYNLHKTEFNESLCHKLMKRDFLSSCDIIEEKVGTDHITFEDKYEKRIVGNVKKKPEK